MREREISSSSYLVISLDGMLGHEKGALKAVSEEEALDVEELGFGNSSADLRGLQVG